jgi:alkylation response protein AidB-like acyl-CoA dehydrogenase
VDHQTLRRSVAAFCDRECGTWEVRRALTDDGRDTHSPEIARKMAEQGWLGIAIPECYGGAGGNLSDLCCFLEAASRGAAPIGAFPASMIVGSAYLRFGAEEQKKEILSGIVAGRVEALALSEPQAGSDLAAVTCRATSVDGGYRIDGQKIWTSNAHLADHILVLARTEEHGTGSNGLSMLQVPAGANGVRISPADTIAGRELNDVQLDSCVVPASAVVGTPGEGWLQVMTTLTFERLVIAAYVLGLAGRAFDDILRHVRRRTQFGQRIGTFQTMRHRLAELATELECCRLLVGQVAANGDHRGGRLSPKEAAMAKLKVTEVAKRICVEGMQMLGAHGTRISSDMERHLRTALLSTLMGGTSEIQREIIGKSMGL